MHTTWLCCQPCEVETHSVRNVLRHEVIDHSNLLYLHEQVAGLSLCTVLEAVLTDLRDQTKEVRLRGRSLKPLLRDLRAQTPEKKNKKKKTRMLKA